MAKKTYKIKGMDCPSCAAMLEIDLADAGIICKCSYAKETLETEEEQDIKKLTEIVNKLGYNIV